MKIGAFITGYKGMLFLKKNNTNIKFIVSYHDTNTDVKFYNDIILICKERKIDFYNKKDFDYNLCNLVDKVFVIGWQFLLDNSNDKFIVFHDAYLPFMRGFSPTVNALVAGHSYLGATAFSPTNEIDKGPIYKRVKIPIVYPIKLKKAINLIIDAYCEIAKDICDDNFALEYDTFEASTFSIWRNADDYKINWTYTNDTIKRIVDSLGFPYSGATTSYKGEQIYVHEVECINMKFDHLDCNCGKIFSITNNQPVIICKNGVIKILEAVNAEGIDIVFNKLREKLL